MSDDEYQENGEQGSYRLLGLAKYVANNLGVNYVDDGANFPYIRSNYNVKEYLFMIPIKTNEGHKYYKVMFNIVDDIDHSLKEISVELQRLINKDQIKEFLK